MRMARFKTRSLVGLGLMGLIWWLGCGALRADDFHELLAARSGAQGLSAQLKCFATSRMGQISEHVWTFVPIPAAKGGVGPATATLFSELPQKLQHVLKAQLQKTGDVSAVIETPTSFLIYLAKERTENTLAVASLSLAKLDCDA